MTKKLQTFNAIQSWVRRLLNDLTQDAREFEGLHDQATAQHKNKLESLLNQLNEQFCKLQDELISVATEITEPQLKGCNDSVDQLHNTVRTQSKTVETYLRDFEAKEAKIAEQNAKVAAEAAAAAANAAVEADRIARARTKPDEKPFVFNKALQPQTKPNSSFTMHELRSWIQDFEAFFTNNRLDEQPGQVQQIYLKNALESKLEKELFDKVKDSTVPVLGGAGSGSCLDLLTQIIENRNPIEVRRFKFYRCNQRPNEKLSAWRVRLKEQARECELATFTMEDHIYFRQLIGTHDEKFREELLKLQNKTDADIEKLVATFESRQTLQEALEPNKVKVDGISAYKKDKKDKQKSKIQQKHSSNTDKEQQCSRCGRSNCAGKDKCPAMNTECKKCGKRNHWSPVCKTPDDKIIKNDESDEKVDAKAVKIKVSAIKTFATQSHTDQSTSTPLAEITIKSPNGTAITTFAIPDTGATMPIIAADIVKQMQLKTDATRKAEISAFNGSISQCIGAVDLQIEFQGSTIATSAYVTPDIINEIYLGWKQLEDLNMIPAGFPYTKANKSTDISETEKVPIPDSNSNQLEEEGKEDMAKVKSNFNKLEKDLPMLEQGDQVLVNFCTDSKCNSPLTGTILYLLYTTKNGYSYRVQLDDQALPMWINWKFLRLYKFADSNSDYIEEDNNEGTEEDTVFSTATVP